VPAYRAVFGECVGDDAAVISEVTRRQRLVDKDGDLELDALRHWKPMLLVENWRDALALPAACH